MTKHLKYLVAAAALSGAFALPAFAGENNGFAEGAVNVYMKDGGYVQTMVRDAKMLDDLVKGGTEIAAGSMVVMHNGKTYLVRDAKMSDGMMMSEKVVSHK